MPSTRQFDYRKSKLLGRNAMNLPRYLLIIVFLAIIFVFGSFVKAAKEQKATNFPEEEVKKMLSNEQKKTIADLELEKLQLENQKILLEINSFGKPSKWELIKNSVTFFGLIVPVMIAIATFLYQRQAELRMEKIRAFERAQEMIEKGQKSSGILQLSLLGKKAIPHLLGQVLVEETHIEWPSSSLAALAGLKRIGIEYLTLTDKNYLNNKVNMAFDEINLCKANINEYFKSKEEKWVKPISKRTVIKDFHNIHKHIVLINEITSIIGINPEWEKRIFQSEQYCDAIKQEFM
jgi:hypothetical protein